MTPSLLRRMIAVFDCELYNVFGAGTEAGACRWYPEDHRAALEGRAPARIDRAIGLGAASTFVSSTTMPTRSAGRDARAVRDT
ncbi:MAG: hypothetical protein R2715_08075 [Ilumatobacteraceae bacterium]